MITTINKFKKLNESIEQYDFGFTTLINSSDVSYYNEDVIIDKSKEQYIETNNLNINWEMDFDNRKYGINSMAPVIKKISGYYTVITQNEDDTDETETEFQPVLSEWTITTEIGNFEFSHTIMPNSIEINFKEKTINIQF